MDHPTTEPGPLARYLLDDHRRLEALLDRAMASDPLDLVAYGAFREGLLRHIKIEERVLLADARRRRGGVPLPEAARLRVEHSAVAMLLVPPPDAALVDEIRALLAAHNPLEEGPSGVYAVCEALAGPAVEDLLAEARAVTVPRVREYRDDPRVPRTAAEALRVAEGKQPLPPHPDEEADEQGVG